uniref:Endonuclease/exonuclease/phosphatase domain-containing protein n=1 Tax=Timema monikensis TaxID=170555 RepID=A0A7R9E4H4_9NEOP|nr:unnamed protein product [Timema monikensis]
MVNTKRGSILFTAIYKPPQATLRTQDLDELTQTGNIVLAGVLNSKNTNWNSRTTTANGSILKKHADNNDYLMITPNEPKVYPSNCLRKPDIIDVVLTDIGITPEDLTVLHELDSDQNPIFCEIRITADIEIKGLTNNEITCNWDTFKTWKKPRMLHLFMSTVQKALKQSHPTSGKITHN